MRAKTITIFSIIAGIIIINVFFLKILTSANEKIAKNIKFKTVTVENITFSLPDYFSPQKTKKEGKWRIYPFKGNRCYFRVSCGNGNSKILDIIAKADLKIEKLPEKDLFILKKLCFIKRLPFPEKGYYYIKHRNKTNHYVLLFENKNRIYYVDMLAPSTITTYKKVFDRIILSIKDGNRKILGKRTEKQLKQVCKETYYILCQSEKALVIGIPTIIGFIILIIFLIATKNMGKLPEDIVSRGIIPLYSEEDISTTAKLGGHAKWILTAMIIESNGVHVFYRRKKLFFIEKEKAKELFQEKRFLFWKCIQLTINKKNLENVPYFLKVSIFKNIVFRFYPQDKKKIIETIKNL